MKSNLNVSRNWFKEGEKNPILDNHLFVKHDTASLAYTDSEYVGE